MFEVVSDSVAKEPLESSQNLIVGISSTYFSASALTRFDQGHFALLNKSLAGHDDVGGETGPGVGQEGA